MNFLLDVSTNFVANVAFWLILGVGFVAAGRTVERRLVRFFGLRNRRRMQVYLSNAANPAPRPDGRPRLALAFHEFQAIESVTKLFGTAPLRLPELTRGLVDGMWSRRAISFQVEVSPTTTDGSHLSDSCVVIGSGARNSIRRFAVDRKLVKATLDAEERPSNQWYSAGDEVTVAVRLDGDNVQRVVARKNVAVIEKVCGADGESVNFFCTGVRGDSSWAAVEYLIQNWKTLVREFSGDEFVIVLGIPWGDGTYFTEYPEPSRIATIRSATTSQ